MAKKQGTRYVCTNCGAVSSAWSGRCSVCGEWNTLQEELVLDVPGSLRARGKTLKSEPVKVVAKHDQSRFESGMAEVDNVLGGGFVPGSVNLIAGQPGIGKSTLLLQLAQEIAKRHNVLYVSGEESAHQIGLRAKRLAVDGNRLQIATSSSADDIAATIAGGDYQLVIVDSIQTTTCSELSSASGSVSQITGSAQILTIAAKKTGTALVIVGHVTKEGSIAGPKVLEHLVDVVLQMEGDTYGGFKILRSTKNRFGSISETGIFEMLDNGLQPVQNPSAALLAERQNSDGSVVFATVEGTRPLLVEIQALVNRTNYGYPKRTASGIDLNRVNLLVAVLERRTKLKLSDQDIYINVVGGIRISEPAADLAVCMAIASAAKGLQLSSNAVVFGEVGLSGEIRRVPFLEQRISEAKKLGFEAAIGPSQKPNQKEPMLRSVSNVRDALNKFLKQ
jgi:DNA repair protein RadA/Sms